jgi:hypothetical protein
VPSASPSPRSSEVTKPRLDTPPINPSSVKPSVAEDFVITQEKSEKTHSKSDDKSEDATGSRDGVKPPVSSKKKFPYEED